MKTFNKYLARVRKANPLINAKYRASPLENKIITKMISMISVKDTEFKEYTFNIKDLLGELGAGKDNHSSIRKATFRLVQRCIEIEEEDGLLQISVLSSVKYHDKEGKISLCFDPKLKPYLLQLKGRYKTYIFKHILNLDSFYAQRFYELLKQYEFSGKRTMKITEIKNLFLIKDDEYVMYNNFKRKVLLQAQKEINEKTDINISFNEIKIGRKVDSIEFHINKKEVINTEVINKNEIKIGRFININEIPEPYKSSMWERVNTYKENLNKMPSPRMIQGWYGKLKTGEEI